MTNYVIQFGGGYLLIDCELSIYFNELRYRLLPPNYVIPKCLFRLCD